MTPRALWQGCLVGASLPGPFLRQAVYHLASGTLLERVVGTPQDDSDVYRRLLEGRDCPQEFVQGRIVHVCSQLGPGGTERQIAQTVSGQIDRPTVESITVLCQNLSERNSDFFASAMRQKGATVREIDWPPLFLKRPGHEMPRALSSVTASLPATLMFRASLLYREFKALKPEVVHAWLDRPNVLAGIAAILAGVPRIVLSGRSVNPTNFPGAPYYLRPAYQALADYPNLVLLNNSHAGVQDYAAWLGLPEERFEVLYNGLDIMGRPRRSDTQINDVRKSWGVAEGGKVVGGIFRFSEEKRPLLWIEAAALVARQDPNVRFVAFGDGPMMAAVRQKVGQYGLADRILLPGLTRDPTGMISGFDVFLLVSRIEGLSNVLLEAQLVGVPVIATAAGGCAEALLPGRTGLLLESDEPDYVATRVAAALEDKSFTRSARESGPGFVELRFGLERMIRESLACYGGSFAMGAGRV